MSRHFALGERDGGLRGADIGRDGSAVIVEALDLCRGPGVIRVGVEADPENFGHPALLRRYQRIDIGGGLEHLGGRSAPGLGQLS